MTTLRNNFSAGPDGTAVSVGNSNANDDDAVDSVTVSGTGGSYCQYQDALARPTSEFAMECASGTGGTGLSYVSWTTSMGAQSTIYARWYARFTTMPTSSNNDNVLFMAWNGATHCASVWVDNLGGAVGKPSLLSGGGVSTYTSLAIAAGVWHRFEVKMVFSTTVGAGTLRVYSDTNADGDTPTATCSQSSANYGASTANEFRLGCGNPLLNQTATQHTGWELNNVDWPGALPPRLGKGAPAGNMVNSIAIQTDNSW